MSILHLAVNNTPYKVGYTVGREGICGIDVYYLDDDQAQLHYISDDLKEVNCEECLAALQALTLQNRRIKSMIKAYGDSILIQCETEPYKPHERPSDGTMRECCEQEYCKNDYSDARILEGSVIDSTDCKDHKALNVGDSVFFIGYSAKRFPQLGDKAYIINHYDVLAIGVTE